jgi:hypothetical protein
MLTLLVIVALVLVGASLADGFSTVHFLKNPGYVEANPLFGPRPSTARIFGEGMGIIAAEIAAAFLIAWLYAPLGWLLIVGGLVQAGLHVHFAIKNYRIPV